MISTNYNSSFPDQVVPDEEKQTLEYGVKVGQAIEFEWFRNNRSGGDRFLSNYQNYHRLKLYARGEQSIQKYKDELAINGDLSYLNLDWKPVPVISKFVDIVVNGMSQRSYEIKAFAQDPESLKKRTNYAERIMRDMVAKEFLDNVQSTLGVNMYSTDPEKLPKDVNELSLKMQLDFKESVEIAEEQAINTILDKSKYDEARKRVIYDLVVLGIGCTKTSFNLTEGIKTEYVDPASLVYSYTEDPNFEDLYYVGEVKTVSLPELKKQFPSLTPEDLKQINKVGSSGNYLRGYNGGQGDDDQVNVLFFEYKTYSDQIFKIKQTDQGLEKALEKPDTFNPPKNDNFERVGRSIEVLYSGAKILGQNMMLKWEMSENMTRPTADTTKVKMNYSICAPRMYKGKVQSLVSRVTGFADMIQLTHLKIQQVLSRMVPDGVYLDVDGLSEVDLGNGTNYNPQEALNMYFQTGSIIGRSLTQDGDPNRGKVPIQELQSSNGQAKLSALISTYQYYLQMIRDVTGLNEARDGSTPDKNALVGLQKIAAANSNTATRHILQAQLYLTLSTCENIALRLADALAYPLTAQSLKQSISTYNVGTLEELSTLQLHDFGIFLELEPDEEERAKMENNIQTALSAGLIGLDDAIDIRNIANIKTANEFLKVRQQQKAKREQEAQQANMQAQAQANSQLAQQTALAETQKQQVLTEQKIQLEQAKMQFDVQKLQQEAAIKKQLMQTEFDFNMQLAMANSQSQTSKENNKEDRKDDRAKIVASQQSELINQRQNNSPPKNFESSGMDVLGGFGLEQFDPK
tara:strand:- start:1389 stop:3797 length:2409 start_codon:yes stop_codon:yes gene_type:complete